MIQFGRKLGWSNCYYMSMFSLKAISTHIHVKSRPPLWRSPDALQWHHNERDDISDHKPHDCLLSRLSSMHCPAKERKWFRLADQEVHSKLVIAIHEIFVSFPPACNHPVNTTSWCPRRLGMDKVLWTSLCRLRMNGHRNDFMETCAMRDDNHKPALTSKRRRGNFYPLRLIESKESHQVSMTFCLRFAILLTLRFLKIICSNVILPLPKRH